MLYLDIKKGKDSIKASDYQQDIGGTDVFINIIMKSNKGCGQLL